MTCRQLGLTHPKVVRFIAGLARDVIAQDAAATAFRNQMTASVADLVHTPRVELLAGRWLRDLIIDEIINILASWFSDQDLSRELNCACIQISVPTVCGDAYVLPLSLEAPAHLGQIIIRQ